MSNAIIDMLTEKCDRLTAENAALRDQLQAAADAALGRAQERVKLEAEIERLRKAYTDVADAVCRESTGPEEVERLARATRWQRDELVAQLATARAAAQQEAEELRAQLVDAGNAATVYAKECDNLRAQLATARADALREVREPRLVEAARAFYSYGATRGNHADDGSHPGPLSGHISAMADLVRALLDGRDDVSDAIDILTARVERLQRMLGAEWQRREEAERELESAAYARDFWKDQCNQTFGERDALKAQLATEQQRREEAEKLLTEFGIVTCRWCNGAGWDAEEGEHGEPVQVQCQFCQALGWMRDPQDVAQQLATARADALREVREKVEKALDAAVARGELYSWTKESSMLGPNVRGVITSRRGDLCDMARDIRVALIDGGTA